MGRTRCVYSLKITEASDRFRFLVPYPRAMLKSVVVDVKDGQLFANGQTPVSIKGVNWRGPESGPKPPNGLQHHPLDWYFSFLTSNGFNAIRLSVNLRDVIDNPKVDLSKLTLIPEEWQAPAFDE